MVFSESFKYLILLKLCKIMKGLIFGEFLF